MAEQTAMNWTPDSVWESLMQGNQRFVTGNLDESTHYNILQRRMELEQGQAPIATIFGCSDSRVGAEMVFDKGLGDLFVVRTAGHVVDSGVLGSLEFSVEVLGTPLILVLGHDHCGAIRATTEAMRSGKMPGGFMRDLVQRVLPGLLCFDHVDSVDDHDLLTHHVSETTSLIMQRSVAIHKKVESGQVAVVGCTYQLGAGSVNLVEAHGLSESLVRRYSPDSTAS